MNKMFPVVLMVLDLAAAIMYVPSADWRHVTYWVAAAVLTACVTF